MCRPAPTLVEKTLAWELRLSLALIAAGVAFIFTGRG